MDIFNLSIGIASLAVSLIAIVIICLIKANIKNMLDSNTILFDENFIVKKDVLTNALNLVDDVAMFGKKIVSETAFSKKAKDCYNNLLCVANNLNLVKTFKKITLDSNTEISSFDLENFKIECRLEIGLKAKKLKQT